MATGLMVICLGQATRFAGELLDAQKTYLADVTLGTRTSTGDREGAVISTQPLTLREKDIEPAIGQFRGDILQTPPMHSALKQDGVPLYKMARQGKEVERLPRAVTIYSIVLEQVSLPLLRIRVTCSKGTYIRVLAEDIGMTLGCGAHLSGLVRTGLGNFQLQDAQTLESLAALSEFQRDACLKPPDQLIASFPALTLDMGGASRFLQGQAIQTGAGLSLVEHRVYDSAGLFLGTAVVDQTGRAHPRKVFPQSH